jgi:hypothetical protein
MLLNFFKYEEAKYEFFLIAMPVKTYAFEIIDFWGLVLLKKSKYSILHYCKLMLLTPKN